ncbi:MAG: nitroreductase [Acidobacteriota bacterium]
MSNATLHDPESVHHAITSRRSVRAFRSDPVDRALLERILADAARAPSGTNIQPWTVHVLQGAARDDLVAKATERFRSGKGDGLGEYYPSEFVEPYLSRRRKIGWDMYGLLGIGKGDREASAAAHCRNFEFFGAPVGLILTMHETMRKGGWMDLGLYLSNVMALAQAHGLATCPQAAWLEMERLLEEELDVPGDHQIVVGLSIGYEDQTHPLAQLATERAALDEFVTWHEAK